MIQFNLEQVPLSRRGSWLGVSRLPAKRALELGKEPGLFIRTLRGCVAMDKREVFRVKFLDPSTGKPLKVVDDAGPAGCVFSGPRGARAEVVFSDTDCLRILGSGCVLRLEADTRAYDYARPAAAGEWELNLFTQRCQLLLTQLAGEVTVAAPWHHEKSLSITADVRPGPDGRWDIRLQEFVAAPPRRRNARPVDGIRRQLQAEFGEFLDKLPQVPEHLAATRALAGYVLWSALVPPGGQLKREGMLMSKNWMPQIWSWDHCFNAIALAPGHPQLAWDQWAVLFDHQHPSGMLPDCINDRDIIWNFTKPPVHGWALREMRARGFKPGRQQLLQAVDWLEKQAGWWLKHRDDDADGIPQYNHGNDSGWDNATCFGAGMPVEGPDLCAFLIVTMDTVADLWEELGEPANALSWRHRSGSLARRLIKHSWRDGRFVAPRSGDHVLAEGDSLVNFMPLLIGRRLPAEVRKALVAGLAEPGRFITDFGLATESPRSPLYRPDGYWRGPVWAPSTELIVSALDGCAEHALARDISARFCRAVEQSGSAENFDALTGAGLRDRAYTWTASAFLTLASGLTDGPSGNRTA